MRKLSCCGCIESPTSVCWDRAACDAQFAGGPTTPLHAPPVSIRCLPIHLDLLSATHHHEHAPPIPSAQEWIQVTKEAAKGGSDASTGARRVLVITHHPPVPEMIHEESSVDSPAAAAEVSLRPDLGAGVDVWVSGHTHVRRQVGCWQLVGAPFCFCS